MRSSEMISGHAHGVSVVEICGGAGGQAIGLEAAGFEHRAIVEIDRHACATLRTNRPSWTVMEKDARLLTGHGLEGVSLFAGGVPCPPFSVAGKQLGQDDERDMFPTALRLVREIEPSAVMFENVQGITAPRFSAYLASIVSELERYGYIVTHRVLKASSFGVPQLRPRFVLVGLRPRFSRHFEWPEERDVACSVGGSLADLMAEGGWPGAAAWSQKANVVAPTLVGGSKLHGGADLGPTRAKAQWAKMGVDAKGVASAAPSASFPVDGAPKLTVRMAARLQGFPDAWRFCGGKTAAYRQVANAFPPPVAEAVGRSLMRALSGVSDAQVVA